MCTFFGGVLLSVLRSTFLVGELASILNEYIADVNLVHLRLDFRCQVKHVFSSNKFGHAWRMQTSFGLIIEDAKDRYVLCVARVLLLFRLNYQLDSVVAAFVFLPYVKFIPGAERGG